MYITKLYKKLISEISQLSNEKLLEKYADELTYATGDFYSNSEDKYLKELESELLKRLRNEK